MANVMDKVFKITYITAYALCGVFLIFYLIDFFSIWALVIGYGVVTVVLFFLGYLIQERLDTILQLYLIIVGILSILSLFLIAGWDRLWVFLVGGCLIGLAFLFDEFFESGE